MAVVLPDWCELARGDGPVLLVAPHGGRRPRVDPAAPPPNLKVNDVHTAELTRELASRLGATAVINHGCDRNELDLNRISQVRRRAPWFLELLRDEVEKILSRHAQAEILFVHGWNVGQAKCDLGIGAKVTSDGLVTSSGGRLTITKSYLDERIAGLRAALKERDIATFLGVRYPASHPNNLLQLFSDRGSEEIHSPIEEQFAGWARDGAVQALQLELGVPLRWPGVWRERLIKCVVGEFRTHPLALRDLSVRPEERPLPSGGVSKPVLSPVEGAVGTCASADALRDGRSEAASSGRTEAQRSVETLAVTRSNLPRRATSLQFYDAVADIGLMSGIGPVGKDTVAARLLLFLGGQRVALFTGERTPPRDDLIVEPLHFETEGETTTLRFTGPILHLEDGTEYLDLEAAFAASRLGEVEVHLRFVADAVDESGATFGRVEGFVDIGSERREISTGAFANAASTRSGLRDGHTVLAAAFGDAYGLLASVGSAGASRVIEFREGQAGEIGCASTVRRDRETIEVMMDEGVVSAIRLSRMEILRSLGAGGYARVTFGTARFRSKDREGHGLYEFANLVEKS